MKTLVRRSIALATVALVASACADDSGSFTLTLESAASVINQSGVDTIGITLGRSHYSKQVTFSATGLPSGVTATFGPTTVSGSISRVILTAAGNATQGPATVVIHANGDGVTERTQEIALTIGLTGSFTLSSEGFPADGAQGGAAVGTVLVVRSGGHGDNVSLSASGLPSGVTASFVSPTTTGDATGLTFNVSNAAAVGSYPITITGSAPGITPDKTTSATLNVVAPPSTASLTVPFCPNHLPVWFAYKNDGYAWQQATPSGSGVTFPATNSVGVAYVFVTNTSTDKHSDFVVNYATRTELASQHLLNCVGSKAVTGTVSGLTAGQSARISMGAAAASATQGAPGFNFTTVASRTLDLVAAKGAMSATAFNIQINPDKLLLQRGLNPSPATSLGTLDFAANGITPQSNTLTIANLNPDDSINVATTFWTATNTYGVVHVFQPTTSVNQIFTMPQASMSAGEFHELLIQTNHNNGFDGRDYYTYIGSMTTHTETLGANLITPTVATLSASPYVRFRGQLASQADYPTATQFIFLQQATASADLDRYVYVVVSAGYLGSTPTTWNATIPQFGGVTGIDYTWLLSSSSVPYQAGAYGGPAAAVFGANAVAGDFISSAYYVDQTGGLAPAIRRPSQRSVQPTVRFRGPGVRR